MIVHVIVLTLTFVAIAWIEHRFAFKTAHGAKHPLIISQFKTCLKSNTFVWVIYILGVGILFYANVAESNQEMITVETNFSFCVFIICFAYYKTCYRHSLDLLTLSIQASRNKLIGRSGKKSKGDDIVVQNEIPLLVLLDGIIPLADTVLLSR